MVNFVPAIVSRHHRFGPIVSRRVGATMAVANIPATDSRRLGEIPVPVSVADIPEVDFCRFGATRTAANTPVLVSRSLRTTQQTAVKTPVALPCGHFCIWTPAALEHAIPSCPRG